MRPARLDAIDIARALALVAMVVYHLIWDLADFGFLPPGAPFTPAMRLASNAIASAFLALVGVSLALARRSGPRPGALPRRLAVLASAAALTTLATFVAEPGAPIVFGILHCIALATVVAALVIRIPALAVAVLGGLAIVAPRILASAAFDSPLVLWLGLGLHEPATLDWRPLLPWAGVVWLSLGLARLLPAPIWRSRLTTWRARDGFTRALAWLGRHSLAFYLAHQPILFAVLFAASTLLGVSDAKEREAFLASCGAACVESGGTIETCARSCACVADKAIRTTAMARLASALWPDPANLKTKAEACVLDTP